MITYVPSYINDQHLENLSQLLIEKGNCQSCNNDVIATIFRNVNPSLFLKKIISKSCEGNGGPAPGKMGDENLLDLISRVRDLKLQKKSLVNSIKYNHLTNEQVAEYVIDNSGLDLGYEVLLLETLYQNGEVELVKKIMNTTVLPSNLLNNNAEEQVVAILNLLLRLDCVHENNFKQVIQMLKDSQPKLLINIAQHFFLKENKVLAKKTLENISLDAEFIKTIDLDQIKLYVSMLIKSGVAYLQHIEKVLCQTYEYRDDLIIFVAWNFLQIDENDIASELLLQIDAHELLLKTNDIELKYAYLDLIVKADLLDISHIREIEIIQSNSELTQLLFRLIQLIKDVERYACLLNEIIAEVDLGLFLRSLDNEKEVKYLIKLIIDKEFVKESDVEQFCMNLIALDIDYFLTAVEVLYSEGSCDKARTYLEWLNISDLNIREVSGCIVERLLGLYKATNMVSSYDLLISQIFISSALTQFSELKIKLTCVFLLEDQNVSAIKYHFEKRNDQLDSEKLPDIQRVQYLFFCQVLQDDDFDKLSVYSELNKIVSFPSPSRLECVELALNQTVVGPLMLIMEDVSLLPSSIHIKMARWIAFALMYKFERSDFCKIDFLSLLRWLVIAGEFDVAQSILIKVYEKSRYANYAYLYISLFCWMYNKTEMGFEFYRQERKMQPCDDSIDIFLRSVAQVVYGNIQEVKYTLNQLYIKDKTFFLDIKNVKIWGFFSIILKTFGAIRQAYIAKMIAAKIDPYYKTREHLFRSSYLSNSAENHNLPSFEMPEDFQGQSVVETCKYLWESYGEMELIDFLFAHFKVSKRYCVEFGANFDGPTKRLREEFDWNHLLMDRNPISHDEGIRKELVTAENINNLFAKYEVPSEYDFLCIDIDGNDYWVWKAIDEARFSSRVVCIEYNCHFSEQESCSLIYEQDREFQKNKCYGASAAALYKLARQKGYSLICVAGFMNMYFVRDDLLSIEDVGRSLSEFFSYPIDVEQIIEQQGYNWRPSWMDAPDPSVNESCWVKV